MIRHLFTSDSEVRELVKDFERASIAAADFDHSAHIAVGLAYVAEMPLNEATERMRRHIQAFARHHRADALYHETLTVFWMRLLGYLDALYNIEMPHWQRVNSITERWGTRQPVDAHYSPGLISSQAARESWLPPDRLPLPF